MTPSDAFNRRPYERLSRRQFLGVAGVGSLSLLSGVWSAADDKNETLPPPKFLLEWGQHGKGEGEFDACVGIAIGKNDEVYTAEFRLPGSIAIGPDGLIYVPDQGNSRVQKFTRSALTRSARVSRPRRARRGSPDPAAVRDRRSPLACSSRCDDPRAGDLRSAKRRGQETRAERAGDHMTSHPCRK